MSEATSKTRDGTFVVGVGASAGGLEALERFFRTVQTDSDLIFVVIQHLSRKQPSLMDHLLARYSKLPVQYASHEQSIKPGNVYLIPPGKEMILMGGQLLLADRAEGNELSLPIDHFFRSLAQDCRERCVGVILSGTGTDGSRGVCDIHEANGLVLSQDDYSAGFDGMPRAAIATGIVDEILQPDEMPHRIETFVKHRRESSLNASSTGGISSRGSELTRIFVLLRNKFGIDFSHYKPGTITRRIERRLMLRQIHDLETYHDLLAEDAEELQRLYKDLLIGVTRFFRDSAAFDLLSTTVIRQIFEDAEPGSELRFWVAGTGTGEEAYSLAMLIDEEMEKHSKNLTTRIFATDVHQRSLDIATQGRYTAEQVRDIPPERIEKHFVKQPDGYQVTSHLRKMIVFAQHNIIRDAPFTTMHFVSCRNLLIYLNTEAQQKAISLFHFALKVGGTLWLGPSETAGDLDREFDSADEQWRIYRKRRDVKILATDQESVRNHLASQTTNPRSNPRNSVAHQLKVYDKLLSEFMPPSVLVTETRDLEYTFSGASKYLVHKDGRPTSDLVEIVHPDLRVPLLAALQRSIKEQAPVVHAGLRCESVQDEDLKLIVKPFFNRASNRSEYLVIFESEEHSKPAPLMQQADLQGISLEQVRALELELQYAKETLQATIEELETTNQELQSSNEELLASNEELQSTNEELNSVNEELYTVNAEHQRKIAELTELTDDMENLLNSTNVDTIFLDREFRIRKFTPGIARTFNLIPQDVGRRIDSFTHNVKDLALIHSLESVLQSKEPLELEVNDADNHWYLLRILPYVSKQRVDGVVLTLIDITSLKHAEVQLTELSEIVQQSSDAIMRLDLDGTIRTWNRGAEQMFGYEAGDMIGQHLAILMPPDSHAVADVLLKQAAEGKSVSDHRTELLNRQGDSLPISLHVSPIRDMNKTVQGASAIARDISEIKNAEHEIRLAIRRRDQFLAMLSHELRNPFAAILNANSLLKESEIDQETASEAREVVEHQLQHVSRLLDDLLDVARVTNDKLVLHREVVNLTKLALDVVDCVEHQLEIAGQRLELLRPENPLFVEGDVGRLQQAQVNLLVNASKYSPEGTVIGYRLTREGSDAVITIEDAGEGIPSDLADQIFEPFVQAEQTIDRSQGGMGLGLPLVKMIAEAHGGSVSLTSRDGDQGSVFTIRLPLTSAPKAPVSNAAETIPPGTKILLIEDSDGIRRMLARSLQLKGFEVESASNGNEGLEKLNDFKPTIAIIDIGLPDIDGYELARRIRADRSQRQLLVAVTGYGQSEDREKTLNAGFDLHLVKPIDPSELIASMAPFVNVIESDG